jgi:hypothetical protein
MEGYKDSIWAIFAFDDKGRVLAGYNAQMADLTGEDRSGRDYVTAVAAGQDVFVSKNVFPAATDAGMLVFAVAMGVRDDQGKHLGGVVVLPKWSTVTRTLLDPCASATAATASS